jgi:hypothetical protein
LLLACAFDIKWKNLFAADEKQQTLNFIAGELALSPLKKKKFSAVKKQQNLDFIAVKLVPSLLNGKINFQRPKNCKLQVS